jgi:hypothetical protein
MINDYTWLLFLHLECRNESNFTNIIKLTATFQLKSEKAGTYCVGNAGPSFGQAQTYFAVKPLLGSQHSAFNDFVFNNDRDIGNNKNTAHIRFPSQRPHTKLNDNEQTNSMDTKWS